MKKNLGSVIVIVLLLSMNLYGYKWTSTISKTQVYLNDSIYLKYTCDFDDAGELYTIDFYPKANDSFDLTLLKRYESMTGGKKRITFEYIAKLKTVGEVVFDFKPNMKKTTLESIVYTSGSRDDDKGDINFIVEKIQLEKLKVFVNKHDTSMIGIFTLEIKKDENEVNAYEPYHLDVKISGIGNFHDIKAIEYKIDGVKVFSQKPILDIKLTEEGYEGTWNQKFAFIGAKDFRIPSVTIEYFNKQEEKVKSLHISSKHISVIESYKKEALLDEDEKSFTFDFTYLYYFLTFIFGFLMAKIKFKKKKLSSNEKLFTEKVNATKSLDELNILLILNNQKLFQAIIMQLESNDSLSLAQAKKKAIHLKIKKR